jgi:Cu-processing system permease protein
MFWRIATIAFNSFRESVRARVLYGLGALALGTSLYSVAVGAFTLKNAPRVVADLGSASISLYAIIVAIVIAGTSLYRELEQKTIFPILARPLRRSEYVVGKYLGTILTLLVFVAFDAATILLILGAMSGRPMWLIALVPVGVVGAMVLVWWRSPRYSFLASIPISLVCLLVAYTLSIGVPDEQRVVLGMGLLSLMEVCVVAGIATLFASFSSPFLSTVFTFGLFLVGRSAHTLATMPEKTFGTTLKTFGMVLSKIVPNLHIYVPPRPLLTGETQVVSMTQHLLLASVQTLAWVVGLLAVSSLIFRRRDFL